MVIQSSPLRPEGEMQQDEFQLVRNMARKTVSPSRPIVVTNAFAIIDDRATKNVLVGQVVCDVIGVI